MALQPLLLAASGVIAALLLALNSLIKTIAGRERVGFVDLLLTFLATVLLILALVFNRFESDTALGLTSNAVLVVAGIVAAVGIVVLLMELRRPQRLRGSRGLLMLWSGGLAALSVFTVPALARILLTTPTPIPVVGGTTEGTAEATAVVVPARETEAATEAFVATDTPESTDTPARTPTDTRTPRSTATATPTRARFRFNTPTPEPTPTLANPCIALVLYNLRLRAEPDHEAETLLTIPYDTTITVYGRNQDSTWWYVIYDDQTGWVDGEFLEVSSSCADAPVQPVR